MQPQVNDTPWGEPHEMVALGPGVWSFHTASHGGLMVTPPALSHIPHIVRACLLEPSNHRKLWAEEDCEMAVVLSILLTAGQLNEAQLNAEFPAALRPHENGRPKIHHFAHQVCDRYSNYAPCRKHLPPQ